jgi:hypothetical protein
MLHAFPIRSHSTIPKVPQSLPSQSLADFFLAQLGTNWHQNQALPVVMTGISGMSNAPSRAAKRLPSSDTA